jgi:hypothetical protein
MNLMLGKLYQIVTNNHSASVCYKECLRYDISSDLLFFGFSIQIHKQFYFSIESHFELKYR